MQVIDGIRYFTRPETAEKIGVTIETLEYWAHKKINLPLYKPGKIALYAEPDIEKYKASKRIGVAP